MHSLFPKLSCNAGLQSGWGLLCGCLGSRLSFPWRRGFSCRRVFCWYSVRLHLEHAAPGLFTRQAGERRWWGDSKSVVPPLLFRPLSILSPCPEPIPPRSLGNKLNMIRRHHTGLESKVRGLHQDVVSSPYFICMENRSQTARTANKVLVWQMWHLDKRLWWQLPLITWQKKKACMRKFHKNEMRLIYAATTEKVYSNACIQKFEFNYAQNWNIA